MTIANSNAYTGGTTVDSGTLVMGNAAALGTAGSPLTVNGGVLDLQGYNLTVGVLAGSGGTVLSSSAAARRC